MKSAARLHTLGQSLWLDHISRDLLSSGTLQRYCDDFFVTGLTSNPTIFEQAIRATGAYDMSIGRLADLGKTGEALFYELALDDLRQAAELFRPIHETSGGIDGWVSLELSPLLADDPVTTVEEAKRLFARADCSNLFIKIPGTAAGVAAIEAAIFAGVPVNVTLLFSPDQYGAAADAYWRGIRRRLDAGLHAQVASVASIFVSRWDKAVADTVPPPLHNRLGIALARRIYRMSLERLDSQEWQTLAMAGALPQRLLWASTGTKDPQIPPTYYVEALAAPQTINTMPEKTLLALASYSGSPALMPADGGDADKVLAEFAGAGVDTAALAAQLQQEGAQSFSASWHGLLAILAEKTGSARTAPSNF